jgi:hypothetical protein
LERETPGRETDDVNDDKGGEGKVYRSRDALRRKALLVG